VEICDFLKKVEAIVACRRVRKIREGCRSSVPWSANLVLKHRSPRSTYGQDMMDTSAIPAIIAALTL
jgi:hypothetical protein